MRLFLFILFFLCSSCPYLSGQWKIVSEGNNDTIKTIPLFDVSFSDEEKVFITSSQRGWHIQEGYVFMTSDSGNTWKTTLRFESVRGSSLSCQCTGTGLVFVYGTGSWVYSSENKGISWQLVELQDIHSLSFVNQSIGYAASDSDSLWSSSDGGYSWNPIRISCPLLDEGISSTFFHRENQGFAMGLYGSVIKIDLQKACRKIETGSYLPSIKAFFTDSLTGWITGGYSNEDRIVSVLLKTSDGGETWSKLPEIDHLIHDFIFIDSLRGWAAAENPDHRGALLQTYNGGLNWKVLIETRLGPLRAVHVQDNMGWAVGDNGTILNSFDIHHYIHELKFDWAKYINGTTYLNPEKDTLHIEAGIVNPGNYPIRLSAIISDNLNTFTDSAQLIKKDGNLWKLSWPIPAGERFYKAKLELIRTDFDFTEHFDFDQILFSTLGPLQLEKASIMPWFSESGTNSVRYNDLLFLQMQISNAGKEQSIRNIDIDLSTMYSNTRVHQPQIKIKEVAASATYDFTMGLSHPDILQFGDSIALRLDMFSNGVYYWSDSMYITLPNPLTDFRFFPNPVMDNITIIIPDRYFILEFYNTHGKKLIHKEYGKTAIYSEEEHPHSVTLDVSHLQSNIYLIKVSVKNTILVQRFIKC